MATSEVLIFKVIEVFVVNEEVILLNKLLGH